MSTLCLCLCSVKISERFVNNYNPLIHYIWNANTDIQIATDTHAVISYITDYMTKSDKGLSKELATALKEKNMLISLTNLIILSRCTLHINKPVSVRLLIG